MNAALIGAILALGPESEAPQRLALVIAHNQSLDAEVEPLRFADDDGARFYEVLSSLGFDTRLLVVLDPDTAEQHPDARVAARPPTWERLSRSLEELRGKVEHAHARGQEVELFVTYSGHGAVGRRGAPYINLLDRRLYRGDFFRDVVAGVGADFVHVVIDACRARDFVDARGGPDGPDFDRELSLFLAQERRARHPEVGVVVAESADGETHEWSRTRSGIFGHEVLSGLVGGADINNDGRIEYSELHAFVAAANHAIKNPRAQLRVTAQPPALNPRRPLLRLDAAPTVARIVTPAAGGRFTVEDDRGVRWADVHLDEGQQATLHLPRRTRFFITDVTGKRDAVAAPTEVPVRVASLSFTAHDSGAVARGSVEEALRSDLFRTAYGPSFYRGFIVAMRYPSAEEPLADELPLADVPLEPVVEPVVDREAEVAASDPLAPPGPTTTPVESERPWSGWRVARWVTGLSAVGLGVVGAGLGIDAWGDAKRLQDDRTNLSQLEYRDQSEEISTRAASADIVLGAAVVAGALWGVSWIFDSGSEP